MTRTTPFQLGAASLLTLVCVLFGGCGIYQSKKDAEAVLAHHFQTIATNGYVTALGDYGPQFFQQTTRDEWMKALTEIESKLGTYQSHTTGGWRVFKNAAWKPPGRRDQGFDSVSGHLLQAHRDGEVHTFQGRNRFQLQDCGVSHQLDRTFDRVSTTPNPIKPPGNREKSLRRARTSLLNRLPQKFPCVKRAILK